MEETRVSVSKHSMTVTRNDLSLRKSVQDVILDFFIGDIVAKVILF